MARTNESPSRLALILIDHGSRLAEANRVVEKLTDYLKKGARRGFSLAVHAHMELAEPTLKTAFARCVEHGATQIVVVPYFLAEGAHVTEDIPRLAAEAAEPYPQVQWVLAPPLGFDARLAGIVLSRALAALASAEKRT